MVPLPPVAGNTYSTVSLIESDIFLPEFVRIAHEHLLRGCYSTVVIGGWTGSFIDRRVRRIAFAFVQTVSDQYPNNQGIACNMKLTTTRRIAAVEAWTSAGMSANQIVLGVAFYGHSFSVSPSDVFVADSTDEPAVYPRFGGVDTCVVYKGGGIWGLVEDGFLTTDGSPAPGIRYHYDARSETPYGCKYALRDRYQKCRKIVNPGPSTSSNKGIYANILLFLDAAASMTRFKRSDTEAHGCSSSTSDSQLNVPMVQATAPSFCQCY
ncbi:hypothetical protein HD554DRAFT_2036590 [Boletus coccyginus]|nr:hypothetical protein HD554DRAFT_2036590 [Boletus coccyginus]